MQSRNWFGNQTFGASLSAATRVVALGALTLLTGCGLFGSNSGSSGSNPPSGPYANVVFLGDSLTAGFQNGSLLDTQQPNGYASLVAKQAGFAITLPLIAAPGAPAVLQLHSTSFPPVITAASGVTTGRDNPTAQPTDLAVPGHTLHDILNYAPPLTPTSGEDLITSLVLGFPVADTKAQLAEAVALKPSTVFVWAGSDDALQADETGIPASMTSLASFTADFAQLMGTLKATGANIVVANVPDVTSIPYMTAAPLLASEIAATTPGLSASVVQAGLGLSNGDLVNAQGLTDVQAQIKALATGGHLSALPDGDVLTAAEITTVQNTIAAYNQIIQQQASAVGATLVDMHAYFITLQAGVALNGTTATTGFLGGLFSLDGIHPTNTGYALLANQFIAALNAKFGSSIAMVNVATVAASDPYFGANIKAMRVPSIPVAAARRADQVMDGFVASK
ncbi:MAG TPA: SGNH/GDSL hydrolase family protein [Acidobacteriaceae bacterium]|nr:SGNH/GDSL hydrolase family protein [Acidobacteriaceae bacterium]